MVEAPHTDPGRELLHTLHKSIGITILALAAIRLMLRATRPVSPEPPNLPRWMGVSARASHWLLYAILFAMPVSGYLLSSAGTVVHGSRGHWLG